MKLNLFNEYNKFDLIPSKIENLFDWIAANEGKMFKSVNIIITNDEEVNRLKKKFYDKDVLTDTICFNLNEPEENIEGEIYLSGDRIIENAKELDLSQHYEFANVLVHSILHLLGYEDDSEEKNQKMQQLQKEYLEEYDYKSIFETGENK